MNHYMRHWNLYIMDELKEENILNKILPDVIHLERYFSIKEEKKKAYFDMLTI